MINNKSYYNFLCSLKSPKFLTIYKNLTNNCCQICDSYACSNNWHCCMIINKIIEEFENFLLIKQKIINFILIEKIKEKNKIPKEIMIVNYLF